jgi:hypothetical protein
MPHHRYKLRQNVMAHVADVPPGPYVITRLLPLVGNEPHYQGKSEDRVVRAFLESQIRAVPEGARIEEGLSPKRSQRRR